MYIVQEIKNEDTYEMQAIQCERCLNKGKINRNFVIKNGEIICIVCGEKIEKKKGE